jgi:hypothetical protein
VADEQVTVWSTTRPPSTNASRARLGGTVQMWEWIGDEGATTFSY